MSPFLTGLPPYATVLGARIERAADGAPVLAMPFSNDVLGRPGFLHGGAITGLLELAAIVALTEALHGEADGSTADPARIKPVNLTVDFTRGGREKTTFAIGLITRLGSRIANVEAIAWQDDRVRPIASARLNYLIVRAG